MSYGVRLRSYCLVAQSRATLSGPHGLYPARLLSPWDFPGKNTGVACPSLLQGIFPTRDWTLVSRTGRQVLFHEPPGKPRDRTRKASFSTRKQMAR